MNSTASYLILLHNNSENLPDLAASLKNIVGISRREYIIVDDASTDNTLSLAQALFASFPRVTILANEAYSGPAYSMHKAMKLLQGDYVHLVFGGQILSPNATLRLIYACESLGAELAFALPGKIDELGNKYKNPHETGEIILIDAPIKAILENKIQDIQTIGYSGTVLSKRLLDKTTGPDIGIFLHNLSFALRCGKHSKFVAVNETLYYLPPSYIPLCDKRFENYENLCAISNFIEAHAEIAEHYKPEIYKALWTILWQLDKYSLQTLPQYVLSRYMNKNLELPGLIQLYREYVDKLR